MTTHLLKSVVGYFQKQSQEFLPSLPMHSEAFINRHVYTVNLHLSLVLKIRCFYYSNTKHQHVLPIALPVAQDPGLATQVYCISSSSYQLLGWRRQCRSFFICLYVVIVLCDITFSFWFSTSNLRHRNSLFIVLVTNLLPYGTCIF